MHDPLPHIMSSLGSCLGILEMLKVVEIFSISTYVFWLECAHWAIRSCCWNGHDKEDGVLARRHCPSIPWCSLHLQLSLAFRAGQIWKVLTILASCEEMECNKNNPALAALLC